jgi:hypothetical protein
MPPPDASKFTGLLSDKDEDDVVDALSSGDAEVRAMAGQILGGLLSGYQDKIVRDQESKNKKSSEKFGDLEFTAEVKSKLGPHMAGYYSPLLDNPSKFIHVLKQKEKVHPDDLTALDKWVGGFYGKKTNPDVPLDYILEMTLGPNWHSKKQNPHQGSPLGVFKKQVIQPGHLYMSPAALKGGWDPASPNLKGHPMDIYAHELGHSARQGLLGSMLDEEGNPVNEEAIQRYEDALYGFSPAMKWQAIDYMSPSNPSTYTAPLAWGQSMQKLQARPNAWATPFGKKPTLDTIAANIDNYGPRQRDKERRGAYW